MLRAVRRNRSLHARLRLDEVVVVHEAVVKLLLHLSGFLIQHVRNVHNLRRSR